MKNKDKMNEMRKGYFKIPHRITTLGISATGLGLYLWLISHSEEFNPSVSQIRRELSLSRPTVYKYIGELLSCNLIKVKLKGFKGRSTVYELVSPKEWVKASIIEKKILTNIEKHEILDI